jgi:predicted DNA-binding protein YlxM (UPF0122 family)
MDRVEIGILRSVYGELLTEKQNEMLKLKYDEDLSYGEIAEAFGVSRQAVLDGINKGKALLEEFEQKLKCVRRDGKLREMLEKIYEAADAEKNECVKTLAKQAIGLLEE